MMEIRNSKLEVRNYIIASFVIVVGLLYFKDVLAACDPGTSPYRAEYLVTSPSLSGKFYSKSNVCIVNGDAQDVAFDIQVVPAYDQLKNDYYTGSKYQRELTALEVSSGSLTLDNQYSYHTSEDLSVTSIQSTGGSAIALIFVEKNLEITSNILFGKGDVTSGLVFIVKGNVYIQPAVTEINAVIIPEGTILTAAPLDGFCDPDAFTQILTINGSLISINPVSAIYFCRRNPDNNLPSEIINNQPKYLILLKNTLSNPQQKWSEL